jgi:hypothetical protein
MSKKRSLAKLRRAEASILFPLGLDRNSFLVSQQVMDKDLVDKISRNLINFDTPNVSVIIAGLDTYQTNNVHAHIYTLHNDYVTCDDVVGFSAIGSGSRHAESQLMLARHAWNSETPETILLAYCAKKNAEIAPGVGVGTDMFMIGPGLGSGSIMNPEIMAKLEVEYQKIKRRQSRIQQEANKEMTRYVDDVVKKANAAHADQSAPKEGAAIGAPGAR